MFILAYTVREGLEGTTRGHTQRRRGILCKLLRYYLTPVSYFERLVGHCAETLVMRVNDVTFANDVILLNASLVRMRSAV